MHVTIRPVKGASFSVKLQAEVYLLHRLEVDLIPLYLDSVTTGCSSPGDSAPHRSSDSGWVKLFR